MAITDKLYSCIPSQDTYLIPYSQDSIDNIGTIHNVYNLFCKEGDIPDTTGLITYYETNLDISSSLPNLNAIFFDPTRESFKVLPSGNSINIASGIAIVNNIFIEITDSSTVFDIIIPTNHINTFSFQETGSNQYAAVCLYFDPSIHTSGAILGIIGDLDNLETVEERTTMETNNNINLDYITVLSIINVNTASNNIIGLSSSYEKSSTSFWKVREVPYWKNIICDGGLIS